MGINTLVPLLCNWSKQGPVRGLTRICLQHYGVPAAASQSCRNFYSCEGRRIKQTDGIWDNKDDSSLPVSIKKSEESPLLAQLRSLIRFNGPMSVHDYMKEVLTNPICGYYMKNVMFGSAGDYITSPEISQMFGEMVGVWIYNEWYKMGNCKPLHLVEFGPGTAVFMSDILRTLKQLGVKLETDIRIHLIEVSPYLRGIQEKLLCENKSDINEDDEGKTGYFNCNVTKDGSKIYWHRHLAAVPQEFSFFIAHEFFDTLPVHKFHRTKDGWREVLIDLDEGNGPHHLRYVLAPGDTVATKLYIKPEDTRDDIEVSPETVLVGTELASRIQENGGAALIIDYGHNGTLGDTFRAFRNHTQLSPLCEPGNADLTSDVDFAFIKQQVEDKLICFGPISQGYFLKNMGIELRLAALLKNATVEQQRSPISNYKMLVDDKQMGERFKVFAIFPQVLKDFLKTYPPVGFYSNVKDK